MKKNARNRVVSKKQSAAASQCFRSQDMFCFPAEREKNKHPGILWSAPLSFPPRMIQPRGGPAVRRTLSRFPPSGSTPRSRGFEASKASDFRGPSTKYVQKKSVFLDEWEFSTAIKRKVTWEDETPFKRLSRNFMKRTLFRKRQTRLKTPFLQGSEF